MTATVNFKHRLFFGTIKINDVVTDDFLAIKIQAFKLPFFQLIPQQHFRQVACPAQCFRPFLQLGVVG